MTLAIGDLNRSFAANFPVLKLMVSAAFYIFWVGILVVFYTYLGYGLVIFVLSKIRGRTPLYLSQADTELPRVTMLIAAFNEESFIVEKIKNTLTLDYPADLLSILL